MLSLWLALACSASYGVADFAGGLAARDAHVLRVVAISAPASLVVELVLLPAVGARWEVGVLLWGAASGVASAAAFVLLYETLAAGPMSVLSPVTAVVSAALPVAVGLGLGERLSPTAVVGVPLAAGAVVLISAARGPQHSGPALMPLLLAVGAGAAIALQLICLDRAPSDSGVGPLVVGRAVSAAITVCGVVTRRGHLGHRRAGPLLSLAAGGFDSLANFAFLVATRNGELAIVAVVTALYPATTLALARGVLRERLSATQVGGLAAAAVAVALLAPS